MLNSMPIENQLAFESWGEQVNLGGARATCPNVEPPLLKTYLRSVTSESRAEWSSTFVPPCMGTRRHGQMGHLLPPGKGKNL